MVLSIMEEQEKLGNSFIEDVQERIAQMDTQYLTGFRGYMETVTNTKRAVSATPMLFNITTAHLLL